MVNKYNNKKVELDGVLFDSKTEMQRYAELKIMEQCKIIKDLVLQPNYILQDRFTRGKKVIRPITYSGDFLYIEDGKTVVEDVKGFKTEVYKLKKKLFLNKYPNIIFREVIKKGKNLVISKEYL